MKERVSVCLAGFDLNSFRFPKMYNMCQILFFPQIDRNYGNETKIREYKVQLYFNLENESKGPSTHNLSCVMYSDWFK